MYVCTYREYSLCGQGVRGDAAWGSTLNLRKARAHVQMEAAVIRQCYASHSKGACVESSPQHCPSAHGQLPWRTSMLSSRLSMRQRRRLGNQSGQSLLELMAGHHGARQAHTNGGTVRCQYRFDPGGSSIQISAWSVPNESASTARLLLLGPKRATERPLARALRLQTRLRDLQLGRLLTCGRETEHCRRAAGQARSARVSRIAKLIQSAVESLIVADREADSQSAR